MPRKYSTPVYTRDIPWQAYDAVIVTGLLLSGWLALLLHPVFWLGAAVLAWGSFIEPRLLLVKRFRLGEREKVLRAAFLSDLHVGPYKKERWLRRLVRKTMKERPDLILIGGDLIYHDPEDVRFLAPLAALRAPLGVFAILGNHDERFGGEKVRSALERAGMRVLRNETVRIGHGEGNVAIVGVVDDWYAETELERAFSGVEGGDVVVALVHNPDLAPHAAKALSASGAASALMLSGHTHGGQIRMPFLGPVAPLPHHLGRRYDRGLFDMGGIPYVIGAGAGESGPRARLFCPPEIVVVEWRA